MTLEEARGLVARCAGRGSPGGPRGARGARSGCAGCDLEADAPAAATRRSPSTSITKRPNSSGSASRALDLVERDRLASRGAPREERLAPPRASSSSTRKSTSSPLGAPDRTPPPRSRRSPRRPAPRRAPTAPEPSATPSRISTSPRDRRTSASARRGSSRRRRARTAASGTLTSVDLRARRAAAARRKRSSCANAVPSDARVRAATPIGFQPGTRVGRSTSAEGRSTSAPKSVVAAASTGPEPSHAALPEEPADRVRERRRRRRPACPRRPTSRLPGSTPVSTPTPTSPTRSPRAAAARPLAGRNQSASSAMKSGRLEFATAGHARVDVLLAPGDQRERHRRVHHAEHEPAPPDGAQLARPRAPPRVTTRKPSSSDEGDQRRGSASSSPAGSRATPTLMNRYDAPQIADSSSSERDVALGHARPHG